MRAVKIATIAKATFVAVVASGVVLGLAGPAHATSGTMYGDPAAAAKYWRYQQYWDDCTLMASADVVGEITGVSPPRRTSSTGPRRPLAHRALARSTPGRPTRMTRIQARARGFGTSRRCWRSTTSAP